MNKPKLSIKSQIGAYIHCKLCAQELLDGDYRTFGESAKSYSRYSVGWTLRGLQMWCNRHNCNVINIDFEGAKHPSVTVRDKP